MKKKTLVIIALIVLAFGGLITWTLVQKSASTNYDANSIIAGNEHNGNISDHVKGNPDAPVLIFEYADYQCPGCATMNPRINKLIDEYDGKIGLVYRNFLLDYHQNGTAAASAAEAAGLQGYWKPYADYLFSNQSTWENASASQREELFTQFFNTITNNQGDTDKFKADMKSSAVRKKIDFDMGIAKKIDVSATPSLYLNGEKIDFSKAGTEDLFLKLMREKINPLLGDDAPVTSSDTTEN